MEHLCFEYIRQRRVVERWAHARVGVRSIRVRRASRARSVPRATTLSDNITSCATTPRETIVRCITLRENIAWFIGPLIYLATARLRSYVVLSFSKHFAFYCLSLLLWLIYSVAGKLNGTASKWPTRRRVYYIQSASDVLITDHDHFVNYQQIYNVDKA